MPKNDESPQSLTVVIPEGSVDIAKALGDHTPFALGSSHMARYVATMTAERQEVFELEMAQVQARIRLQEARRARQSEGRAESTKQNAAPYRAEEMPEYLPTPRPIVTRTKSFDFSSSNEMSPEHPTGRIQRDKKPEPFSDSFSDIYSGSFIQDNGKVTKVAIRVLRGPNNGDMVEEIRKSLIRETMVWQNLRHPNILRFLGLSHEHGQFGCPALITPYHEQETVNDYLELHPELDKRLPIIRGVSEGLRYLHQHDVVHGDLEPSNILIDEDGHPLLCNFGYFRVLKRRGSTIRAAGDYRYQAPELLGGIEPNNATDVYAFALSSYEIWTGLQPFYDINGDISLVLSVANGKARLNRPDPAPTGTDFLWMIFERCWKSIPEERLGMETVARELAHSPIPAE